MKKRDGFPGQQSFVIPEQIIENIKKLPVCNDLYLTDIGYYPNASYHFRERPIGVDQNILIYNVGGKGTIRFKREEVRLPEDHFIIIPAKVAHAYYADKKTPWSIYWMHFTGTKSKYFVRTNIKPIEIKRTKLSRINERIAMFDEIFNNLERGFSTETLEYVNLCLPRLLATFTHIPQYRVINEKFSKDPVNQSINFMLENTNKKLTLKNISDALDISVSHYSRLFFEHTGHSPIEYFIQLKMQRACQLLDTTTLSIAEVALEMGFEDSFYFSRQFKKEMNMSPLQYRKR
jgi:AraC-like DNA-binding protein